MPLLPSLSEHPATPPAGATERPGWLPRLARADLSRGRAAWLFAAVFVLVRTPLLGGGHGADTDAYRVVLAGRYLWATGEYLPSRLPGFPLHELSMLPLLWGGPLLTNIATTLVALAGALLFARIAARGPSPAPGLATLGFAFAPYMLVTSTATLDYHWALTALLGSYLAVLRRRDGAAGVLLGMAIGLRITSAVFALPLAWLVLYDGGRWQGDRHVAWQRVGVVTGVAALMAAVAYLPVAIPYHGRFLDYADSAVSPDGVIRVVGQWALGAAGALAVLVALAVSWRGVARLPALAARRVEVGAWGLAVAVWTAAFLWLPVDLGYLVPLFPFGFLLLSLVLPVRRFALVLLVIGVAGFVDLDIQALHNFDPRVAAREVRPRWRVAGLPHDWAERRRWRAYARAVPAAPVPDHSVVLTGGVFPDLAVEWWGRLRYGIVDRDRRAISVLSDNGAMIDDARDVMFLAAPPPAVLAEYRAAGYQLFRAEPAGAGWDEALLVPVPP